LDVSARSLAALHNERLLTI